MAFDPKHIGRVSEPHEQRVTWRDHALYALGIGATRDELPHLYEGHPDGFRTYPTFATITTFQPVFALMADAGFAFEDVVHGNQAVTVHRPLPAEAVTSNVARLDAVYDLKRFAQAVLTTETRVEGELLVETTWTIIVRGGGGFGGPRPPRRSTPKIPKEREADWVEREVTSPEQALLYRLSGDINPLHADPAAAAGVGFERGPILHGLATYGFVARAALRACADGDAGCMRAYHAQFKKPVWPGETIVVRGWDVTDEANSEGRTVALQAHVEGRSDPVVSNAWLELRAGPHD